MDQVEAKAAMVQTALTVLMEQMAPTALTEQTNCGLTEQFCRETRVLVKDQVGVDLDQELIDLAKRDQSTPLFWLIHADAEWLNLF